MKVVNINGRQLLAKSIASEDGVTTIEGSLEFAGSVVTGGVISTYLQKANLGELGVRTLNGASSYEVRDLTKSEAIAFDHEAARFDMAKALAIPQLENTTYANL